MAIKKGRIDFQAINQAAIDRWPELVAAWLPGGEVVGGEYTVPNPTRADRNPGSFKIQLVGKKIGKWIDFSIGEFGSDPISLYAYLFTNDDQGLAAKQLGDLLRVGKSNSSGNVFSATVAVPSPAADVDDEKKKGKWVAVLPVTIASPREIRHLTRHEPDIIYTYRGAAGELLGYICRFTKSTGGKEICPLVCAQHSLTKKIAWRWMQWSEPRPLYGLDRLAAAPAETPILLVEGEKCADIGHAQALPFVVMTWPGGGKAPDKADWSVLAGRTVFIWPDCDSVRQRVPRDADPDFIPDYLPAEKQPGAITAAVIADVLLGLGCDISVLAIEPPGVLKHGWDIENAIADCCAGWQLADYINSKAMRFIGKTVTDELPPLAAASAGGEKFAGGSFEQPAETVATSAAHKPWWSDDLIKKSNGAYEPIMSNVAKILRQHPLLKGVARFNEFSFSFERHAAPWDPERAVGDWEDRDDLMLNEWLVDNLNLIIKNQSLIKDSVTLAAFDQQYHPIRNYLLSLPAWDGYERLDYWLSTAIFKERTEYLKLAGRFFLMAMVKRIFQPGCKFDYMLVLEGAQGLGKSSLFRELASPWFSETAFDVNTNEGNMAIQGVWLHEMAEMGQFTRAEDRDFKQFLTVVVDKFRRPYDKRHINAKRVCLFGGTTNLDRYLKDMTGNRRIWPVRCEEVDLDFVAEFKGQLFVEAMVRVSAGERIFPSRDEEDLYFKPEQKARQLDDQWVELLDAFLNSPAPLSFGGTTVRGIKYYNWFPGNYLLIKACGIERQKLDARGESGQRLGRVMAELGWTNVQEPVARAGMIRRHGYLRPFAERNDKSDAEKFSTPDDDFSR